MKYLLWAIIAILSLMQPAFAEATKVRISRQYGINYLPLIIMEKQHILEAKLKEYGLEEVKPEWLELGDAVAINEALISGNLDFATTGPAPMIVIWDKTRSNLGVKAVSAINVIPMDLITNDPAIKTIKDFSPQDKIAVPGAKLSTQAIVLQMAAEGAFGEKERNKLDSNTVTMSHPDATASLLSSHSSIKAAFSTPPYSTLLLKEKGFHSVLSSEQVMGGESTGNLVFTTTKFKESNPKIYLAFLDALNESIDFINQNKEKSAEIYLQIDRLYTKAFLLELLANPSIRFTTEQLRVIDYATFMGKAGIIKHTPATVDELFFAKAHK